MMYEEVVRDFAQRTKENLEAINRLARKSKGQNVYPVTQLVNSLLGLLVFPHERFHQNIPSIPLSELKSQGWPVPTVEVLTERPCDDLKELVRILRNGIAHFNVKFEPGPDHEIAALVISNRHPGTGRETARIRVTVPQLQAIAEKYLELLLESAQPHQEDE